ncbi:MAG: HDOD domain-containing protein [Burkholderiales bacterium]|nr:HDOD domain-containing protein [Nitrosomonas sp.]MCP5275820.1 HDOD domain-containing protein [Burkholderiales bacterium]
MEPHAVAASVKSIFSLPEVVFKINELINSGDTTNIELEQTILNDPALTAKLLKFANSAYFGFPKKIETISNAVALIGHSELRNLAIATSVTSVFKGIPSDLVDMESFWHHSVSTGVIARLMAYDVNRRERIFIAGLLHGIGKLIMFSQFPDESSKILSASNHDEEAMIIAERQIFGFTYADLSAAFLDEWSLPESIWKIVESQLDPAKAVQSKTEAYILHLAVKIAGHKQNHQNREINFDDLQSLCKPEIWDNLGLNTEVIELINTVAELQISDMFNCIKPCAT